MDKLEKESKRVERHIVKKVKNVTIDRNQNYMIIVFPNNFKVSIIVEYVITRKVKKKDKFVDVDYFAYKTDLKTIFRFDHLLKLLQEILTESQIINKKYCSCKLCYFHYFHTYENKLLNECIKNKFQY